MSRRVVIVGAGLAGSRCAQTLRAEGFDGSITLIGDESHPPYERPALSKAFLAGTHGNLALQSAGFWRDGEIRLVRGTQVSRIEPARKLVRTPRGDLRWDALVIATGARPRRVSGLTGTGVHLLRTLTDAERLRRELAHGRRLTIVGAGFVGAEVASVAVDLGLDVTIVDTARLPFERTLGAEVGRFLAERYRAHGVALRLETRVTGLRRDGDGAVRAMVLADGTQHPSDVVLVAVGVEPAGELLGMPGGIRTDTAGRTALPGVYACGDVAAPWHPALRSHLRLEHWTSAAQQAATVARTILGREGSIAPSPYFWSDQFGARLQHVGFSAGWKRVVLDTDRDSLEARYLAADDRLVAALLVNKPHAVPDLRRRLATELRAA